MEDERFWNRIGEVVRKIAIEQGRSAPDAFVSVTGTVWERDAQRRAALVSFAELVDDFPIFTTDTPVEQIADDLDSYWLETHLVDDEEAA